MNCLNGEKYLEESITSILNQKFKNWELIFWDNKSDDASQEIFNSFKDDRLKYFLSSSQTSLHLARNLALSKSTGDLIGFLDTDDYWDENKLILQVKEFEKNSNISCVYSKYFLKYQNTILPKKINKKKNLPSGNIFRDILLNYDIAFATVLLNKKKLLNFPNIFKTDLDYISDFDFITKFAKNNEFACVQLPLVTYRRHKKSMSKINFNKQVGEMGLWLEREKKNNFFSSKNLFYLEKHIENLRFKLRSQEFSLTDLLFFLLKKNSISLKFKSLKYFLFKSLF